MKINMIRHVKMSDQHIFYFFIRKQEYIQSVIIYTMGNMGGESNDLTSKDHHLHIKYQRINIKKEND